MFEIYREKSPLEYVKSNDVHRFGIMSPELIGVPFQNKDTYFVPVERKITRSPRTGRKLKTPEIEIIPGSRPGTIGFVDWHDIDAKSVYIDYMKTRTDWRGRGFGKALVAAFYQNEMTGKDYISWGKIMSEYAFKIYQQMKATYPNIHHSGHIDF